MIFIRQVEAKTRSRGRFQPLAYKTVPLKPTWPNRSTLRTLDLEAGTTARATDPSRSREPTQPPGKTPAIGGGEADRISLAWTAAPGAVSPCCAKRLFCTKVARDVHRTAELVREWSERQYQRQFGGVPPGHHGREQGDSLRY